MTPKTPNSTINRNASTKIVTGILSLELSHGFWIPRRGFWIPGRGFWNPRRGFWIPRRGSQILCQRYLDSGFHELYSGFQPQDSGFHKKKFPRFRNTDSLTWGDWFFGLRWTVPICIYSTKMKSVILQLFPPIFRPETPAFLRVNGLKTRLTPS